MRNSIPRLALAGTTFALASCLAGPAAVDTWGTAVRSAGGYDDPDGTDLILLELHGVEGHRDGVHGLALPEDWRARPRVERRRDGILRLVTLLDGSLTPVGKDHPSAMRRESGAGSQPKWRPTIRPLWVDGYLGDRTIYEAREKSEYAVRILPGDVRRVVEVYGRDGEEWVFLQRLELRSSRTAPGWVLTRILVYPLAFGVDTVGIAIPVAGGLWLTYVLMFPPC